MLTKNVLEKVAFHQKLQEVALLYYLVCEHFLLQGAPKGQLVVPSTFVLVSAFGDFFSDLQVVSGRCAFIVAINETERKVGLNFIEHHWFQWRDESHIIDLVPIDGEFGVSVPQAVLQPEGRKRFFKSKTLHPEDWGNKQKIRFDSEVSALVELLQKLNKKVPL